MREKRKNRDWLDSIRDMYKSGNYNKAINEIVLYNEKYPNDDYGKFLYTKLLLKLDQKKEAKDILEELAYINNNSKVKYSCFLLLARLYAEEGKTNDTEIMINKFLESPYRNKNELIDLASIYQLIGKEDKTKTIINELDLSDLTFNNTISLAEIYTNSGESKKSEKLLDSLAIDNVSPYKLIRLVNLREENESYYKALEALKQALKCMDSKNENYYKYKLKECEILIKKNSIDEVINNCYAMLIDNCPNFKDQIYLTLGDAYIEKYSYQKSKDNYEIVLLSDNKESKEEALYRLGKLNEITNHVEEAKINYEALIDLDSKYKKESFYHLITINIKNHNYEEAYNMFNKLIKTYNTKVNYMETRITNILLNSKLGLDQESRYDYSYVEKQIINFDENKSKEHIIEHRRLSKNEFNNEINFDELYEYTKENLTEDNLCLGDFLDVYEIDYNDIAENKNRYRVIAIPDTKNIITMYPIEDREHKYHKVSKFKEVEKQEKQENDLKKQKLYSKFFKN